MQWALQAGLSCFTVCSDSQVVVHQVRGDYTIHSEKLVEYAKVAQRIKAKFTSFAIEKVPRSANKQADLLSKIASGEVANVRDIHVEVLLHASIHDGDVICATNAESKSWLDDIKDFIEQGVLPESLDQAKTIRRQEARYVVHDGLLYRRSFSKPLLWCIPPSMTKVVLEELHEGVCGRHPGA